MVPKGEEEYCSSHREMTEMKKETCNYVSLKGTRSNITPRGIGEDRCFNHAASKSYVRCRFFAECGGYCRGESGVCRPCYMKKWRLFRREKDAGEALDDILDNWVLEPALVSTVHAPEG